MPTCERIQPDYIETFLISMTNGKRTRLDKVRLPCPARAPPAKSCCSGCGCWLLVLKWNLNWFFTAVHTLVHGSGENPSNQPPRASSRLITLSTPTWEARLYTSGRAWRKAAARWKTEGAFHIRRAADAHFAFLCGLLPTYAFAQLACAARR